ncbi:MAG TPA: GTP cyclohydrolase I, partial [Planctomycetota bacterium]|nr:GTP cyclohydrolase I [Planctomycetota bacterium]
MTVDRKKVEEAVRLLIEGIGDDPARPGLQDTPRRVARMYEEIFEGIGVSGERVVGVLESEQHDEIVLIRDI